MRANYRLLDAATLSRVTRTVNANVAVLLRWVHTDGELEAGTTHQNGRPTPFRAYSARVGLFDTADISFSVTGSYDDCGVGPRRLRVDADASLTRGRRQIEAGSGLGRGQLLGSETHSWLTLELPLRRSMTLLVGRPRPLR